VILQNLHLINFKNYEEIKLDVSAGINVLIGRNGSGKTNLLDAIHYLSMTKSAFTSSDTHAIKSGANFFTIKGNFENGKSIADVLCSVQSGSKKTFRVGANDYQKLSDHIGKYPVVLIAPDDNELVKEGSEERRKFFDAMISQLDRLYLESLMKYAYGLKQRNSLLKMFAETNSFDALALDAYDKIMIESATSIFHKRKEFCAEFLPVFVKYYNFIVDDETANLVYKSDLLSTSMQEGLQNNRQRDLFSQRTNFGIHRDDYVFTLGGGDLKRLGSQGQQKSFIIALKLAQFEIIKQKKGIKPLLLLDDIFDKLDDLRINRLLELVKNEELGQLFLTDARPDRTSSLLKQIGVSAKIFKIEKGKIVSNEQ
jgi:DNA replication and repair protein RecF